MIDYQVAGYEDVTVGSRQYAQCLKVVFKSILKTEEGTSETRGETYYAPDIGQVKTLMRRTGPDGAEVATTLLLSKHEK